MEKKEIYGGDLREQLAANARDRMQRFLLLEGKVRGAIINGTKLVNEMRANHSLGILETLVLGHAYIGALLMTSNMKSADTLSLKIDCSGRIKGLSVEANAFGEVRGYLLRNPIPLEKPLESFDLSPFFKEGTLSVSKMLEKGKRPFTGQVTLKYGTVAQDLAYFALKSEQIPSSFSLSVKFDREGNTTGAGGLLLQAMPGADPSHISKIEEAVGDFPSIGESFAERKEMDMLILQRFPEFTPKLLDSRRVAFMCHCNQNRFSQFLRQLPDNDRKDISRNGPFPLVLTCHNCSSRYTFAKEKVEAIFAG